MKKILFLLIIFLFTCNDDSTEPEEVLEPEIGPAGGYVFYDKGSYTEGWRYLEVAPADTIWELVQGWMPTNIEVEGTYSAVGKGKTNTTHLVAWLGSNGYISFPVKLCNDLSTNGYDDWFLPSIKELDALRKYVHKYDISDYFSDGAYHLVSSSEYGSNKVWAINLRDGDNNADQIINKSSYHDVIAIRSY